MRLVARQLAHRYATGFRAGPLDLDVGPGLYHLAGRNGAGKSTLLRCLCGGHPDATGFLSVGGRDPRTDASARRDVALLSAEPELPDFLTVEEAWQELAALRGAPDWDGARWATRWGLPHRLVLGHASAGQRRLAELIAALAADPAVLLLDEPFANLDPVSAGHVAALLAELREDRVLLLTSHQPPPLPVDGTVQIAASLP